MVAGKNLPPCNFLRSSLALSSLTTPAARVRSTIASSWHLETTQWVPDPSCYGVRLWQARQSRTTVLEKRSIISYHLPSPVLVQPAVHCLIAGPVRCPTCICNDDDELDQLLTLKGRLSHICDMQLLVIGIVSQIRDTQFQLQKMDVTYVWQA